MTSYSIIVPYAPPRPELILPYASLTERTAAHRLWQGQALGCEPHQAFTYAAARGHRIPVGIGVTLMPLRHPFDAAMQAQQLAVTTGEPVVAGYAPGAAALQRALLGEAYASPLGAAREYLNVLRDLLDGKPVDHSGRYVQCHAAVPSLPRPPVEVGMGVLRPGAARLAGEVADVAITWLTPASYLRDVIVPAMEAGASEAGRRRPRLAATVPVALDAPHRTAGESAHAGAGVHMQMPHYVDMLARAGIDLDTSDAGARGDALVGGGGFLFGGPEKVFEGLAEYRDAGVDEIILSVSGVLVTEGQRAAVAELEEILAAVHT